MKNLRVLNKKWANYIKPNYCKPGTMYGLIKTHKENNTVKFITNGLGTAIEYSSIFVEKYLYKEIKNTPDILNIIDLISFDIVNMFHSIDNVSGLEAVSETLENKGTDFPSAECILKAVK